MAQERLEIHFSKVWGVRGVNHIYVYSPSKGVGRGLSLRGDQGVRDPDNTPYIALDVPKSKASKLYKYPGWDSPVYIPYIADCHTSIQGAFNFAGIEYPAAAKRVGRFENFSRYDKIYYIKLCR